MKIGLFGFKTLRQTASCTACYCTTINTKQTVSFLYRKTASDERPGEYKKNKSIYTFYPSKIMKLILTWKKNNMYPLFFSILYDGYLQKQTIHTITTKLFESSKHYLLMLSGCLRALERK